MVISIVGTGYVGLVTGAILADLGHNVFCIDIDSKKVDSLKKGHIPIFEPGLEEIVKRNHKQGRLIFTTDYQKPISVSKIAFICVGTPPGKDGSADTSYLFSAIEEIAKNLTRDLLIVIKSTIPMGLEEKLNKTIKKHTRLPFEIASCPEFLREGSAVEDTKNPDRIVIGAESKQAADLLMELYKPFGGTRIITGLRSAQMIKYAANAFLATKISFANAIALLCDKLGANSDAVLSGIGSDERIGRKFLYPGIGYGGSCFPKDILAFLDIAKQQGYDFELLNVVQRINENQVDIFLTKLKNSLGSFKGNKVAILGLAFKPNTDDIREAPSIKIIKKLLKAGVKIYAYDPIATENAKRELKNTVTFSKDPYQAAKGAQALLIVTEWNEFKELDLEKIKKLMKKPIIIDGRNIYDPEKVRKLGFKYTSIGRP